MQASNTQSDVETRRERQNTQSENIHKLTTTKNQIQRQRYTVRHTGIGKNKKSNRGKNTRINDKLNHTKSDTQANTQPDTRSWRERQKHIEGKSNRHSNTQQHKVIHTDRHTET